MTTAGTALIVAAVLSTHTSTATPIYKYVLANPTVPGQPSDDCARDLELKLNLKHLDGLAVSVGDKCDIEDCDLVKVAELEDHSFRVRFYPKAPKNADANHNEVSTQRWPLDNSTQIWDEGSKSVVNKLVKHYQTAHTANTAHTGPAQ